MPQTILDLSDAYDWLKAHPAVEGDRVAVIGFCMGGTFALVLTAERDDVAAVCFYGFPQGSGAGEHALPVPLELVDRMRGPILGFFGEDDELVGTEPVQRLGEQLAERDGVEFDYTIYQNTGHGFMRHSAFDPEHEWYESAISSWLRMLEFLREQTGVA